MNYNELIFFSCFLLFVLLMLALDLGLFNRKDHFISPREAGAWSILWISLSLLFYLLLLWTGEKIHGIGSMDDLQRILSHYHQPVKIVEGDYEQSLSNYRSVLALEFITGWIIEQSLSVDNIFVMVMIFSAFNVDKKLYHRVLFWGILGAIVFRFIFIFTGAILVNHFSWILYLFAAFLLFTGIKMMFEKDNADQLDVEHHPVVRIASRLFAVHRKFEGNRFFFKSNGKRYVTPLFIVLLIIEFTDIIFALDSVPAVFAVTRDPYIVFFSNIFAILGLRSMFFVLLNVVHKFHYFKIGLSSLLVFIGLKMIFHEFLDNIGFTTMHSLLVIMGILLLSIVASLAFPKKQG